MKWEDPSKFMQERKERENPTNKYRIDRRKEKARPRKEGEGKADGKEDKVCNSLMFLKNNFFDLDSYKTN